MLRMKCVNVTALCLYLLATSLEAQTGTHRPSASAVVASSGNYQLTEQMIQQGLQFGQILAGGDFSSSDAATLRSELIAYFQIGPAKQMETYESVAKALRAVAGIPGHKPSWLDLALARYRVWQAFGENPQAFRDFQNAPFGKMILKYNPVLVNSGGMIVTKKNVDCQFYSNALVGKAAGIALPTQAEEDQFIRTLPSRFASLPREQQEYLRHAELRLVNFWIVYGGTIKTHAIILADIRKSVHSSADVWRAARQVESNAEYPSAKYYQLYRAEVLSAVGHATVTNSDIVALGGLNDSVSRNGDMYRSGGH